MTGLVILCKSKPNLNQSLFRGLSALGYTSASVPKSTASKIQMALEPKMSKIARTAKTTAKTAPNALSLPISTLFFLLLFSIISFHQQVLYQNPFADCFCCYLMSFCVPMPVILILKMLIFY